MLSVLRLNHGKNVTLLHIELEHARADMHGWMRNTLADNWISPPKLHRKEGWVKKGNGESYSERMRTMKAGVCGIQMRTPFTVDVREKQAVLCCWQLVWQSVRISMAPHRWRPRKHGPADTETNKDLHDVDTGTMYKLRVPPVWLLNCFPIIHVSVE